MEDAKERFQTQVYWQLQKLDTEALIAILKRHDSEQWTEDAFAAMRRILLERLGSLPEMGPADDDAEPSPDLEPEDALRARLLRIARWAEWLSLGVVGLAATILVIMVVTFFARSDDTLMSAMSLFPALLYLFLYTAFFFIALQAIAVILAVMAKWDALFSEQPES